MFVNQNDGDVEGKLISPSPTRLPFPFCDWGKKSPEWVRGTQENWTVSHFSFLINQMANLKQFTWLLWLTSFLNVCLKVKFVPEVSFQL